MHPKWLWIIPAVPLAYLAMECLVGAISQFRSRRRRAKAQASADADGLVIFVEGIRWLGIAWDRDTAEAGFRQAGFAGEFLHWRWHENWRAYLVLPAIADRAYLERRATELAELIRQRRAENPGRPIYLIGVSCGGYLTARALELLPPEVQVDGAALISAAIDPWRDLSAAASRIRRPLIISHSLLDWLILGIGTLLTGTGDRRHRPSIGMIGPRGRANRQLVSAGRLRVLSWRPGFLRQGNCGGHFTGAAPRYVAEQVAPALLKSPQPKKAEEHSVN